MKITAPPHYVDPWLSPREAAEVLLHARYVDRSPLQVRNLQKQIEVACRAHMAGEPGIDGDQFGEGGLWRFKLSELERWVRRNSRRGLAYLEALEGWKPKRRGQRG